MSRSTVRAGQFLLTAALIAGATVYVHGAAKSTSLPARAAAASAPKAAVVTPAPAEFEPMVGKYCVGCHSERAKSGGLVLEHKDFSKVGEDPETFEKVVRKLRARAMPPIGSPRPDVATLQNFTNALEMALDKTAGVAPNPGRPPIHRLNRHEYANAVRDLLGLDVDGKAMLPADDTGFGFDNIADVLTVSPGLFERYMLAAAKISRLAVEDPTIRPKLTTYDLPYLSLAQDDRMSEYLPFGSRGGIAVRHYFPLDGDYTVRFTLQRNDLAASYSVRGLNVPTQFDVRLDRARLKLFNLTAGRGAYGGGGGSSATAGMSYPDEGVEVRFHTTAGTHVVGVTMNQDVWKPEGTAVGSLPLTNNGYSQPTSTGAQYGRVDAGIDKLEITGPYDGKPPADSAVRRKVVSCQPATARDEEPCAAKILFRLARLAYRRTPAAADMKTLMDFYQQGRSADGTFGAGIQSALSRLLVDPNFLFRLEQDPDTAKPGTSYQLTDVELASRLSFFLWSSIPDDDLLTLAEQKRLRAPGVLDQQVRRMLLDERANVFVESFFGQWLTTRNVAALHPNPRVFPEFDESLRAAFQQETNLFLQSQLREDRPAVELLTANYTFVNERLARHYGIPGVVGSHFRRVTLPDDKRAGLLGQGSVLMVTSYEDRTSVVVRGKFIMDTIMGTPPPPPPANVPPLDNTKIEGSLRQRMELHRKNPVCASCHNTIDPLGFALENFDGVGRYRTVDSHTPINATGALADGSKFDGSASFRKLLVDRQEAFLGVMTQKLLTYAMGRGVELYDMPAVRKVLRDAKTADYRWSAVIVGIVKSMPFQMRRAQS